MGKEVNPQAILSIYLFVSWCSRNIVATIMTMMITSKRDVDDKLYAVSFADMQPSSLLYLHDSKSSNDGDNDEE